MSTESSSSASLPSSGRLVFCGSTAWEHIGRKLPPKDKLAPLEFPAPHVYGPAAYIDVAKVISHSSSCHAVVIDVNGNAYTFGRNEKGQLGDGTLNNRTEPHLVLLPTSEKIISAAVGRNHTILVTASGKVFGAGENKSNQVGVVGNEKNVTSFTQIEIKKVKFVDVACGAEFTIALTTEGEVYSWGSPQYGQCGDGSEHKYLLGTNRMVFDPQPPKLITFPSPPGSSDQPKITSIACGVNHALALDDDGRIYTWGCGAYGRLGLNETPPKDTMTPAEISGFKDRHNFVKKIACGSTCSLAIDGRNNFWLWGKWKNSGDGGQGTPWTYPKFYQGLAGWEIREIAAGGVALFALAEKSTISWGQNAQSGELGHGANKPRSATNAAKVDDLEDMNVVSVACGLGHTLLIVDKDDPKFSSLPVAFDLVETAPVASPTKGKKRAAPKVVDDDASKEESKPKAKRGRPKKTE